MAVVVSFKFKSGDAQKAIRQLRERAPRAIVRALSRAAGSARTVMAREVSKDLGLKVGTVREQIRLEEPNAETMTARLIVRGARIPLIDFDAKATRRGVTARIQGVRRRYPNAFIARMRSGHEGVFSRSTARRLPIHELRGPSLPHVFTKFLPIGMARGEEQLVKNLRSELKFALSAPV